MVCLSDTPNSRVYSSLSSPQSMCFWKYSRFLFSFDVILHFMLIWAHSLPICVPLHVDPSFQIDNVKVKSVKRAESVQYAVQYVYCKWRNAEGSRRLRFCFENSAVFWDRNWTFCSRNLHVWSLWNSVPVLQQPSGAHAVPRRWVSPEPPKTFKLLQIWTRSLFCLHGIFASARCWAFHAQMGEMWAPRINFSFFPSCALLISKWFSPLYSLFIHRPACHLHLHIFLECTADFNCPAFRPFRFLLSPARKTCRCQGIFKLCCPRLIKKQKSMQCFLVMLGFKIFYWWSFYLNQINWEKCVCFKCFCCTPLLSV